MQAFLIIHYFVALTFNIPCCRFDFAAFMKMDADKNQETLDKMLATLRSDKDWNMADPYEATCAAGDLVRYHFGFASSASTTSFQQETKDVASTSSDTVRIANPLMALSSDVSLDIVVKTECAEEKVLLERIKEVIKIEKEVCGLLNLLKKTKALLASSKKAEGSSKAAECAKQVEVLGKLQDALCDLQATGEAIDKGDSTQMKQWLAEASQSCDLAIDAVALGKSQRAKFTNYLSS